MAGDWIKVRKDLRDDPAVVYMAGRLGRCRAEIVGRLISVWSWADAVTADGHAPCVTNVTLDEFAGLDGFAEAMASTPESPWLVLHEGGGVTFPRFGRHNGESAKKRAIDALRKSLWREKMSHGKRDTCPTNIGTREEKRRESEPWPLTGPMAPPPRAGPVGAAARETATTKTEPETQPRVRRNHLADALAAAERQNGAGNTEGA